MGSVCTFVPQHSWLLLSLGKGGHLSLHDVRSLGRPLLQQQLHGPVFDMAWTMQRAESSMAMELLMSVVGSDSCVRQYPFNAAGLAAGVCCHVF